MYRNISCLLTIFIALTVPDICRRVQLPSVVWADQGKNKLAGAETKRIREKRSSLQFDPSLSLTAEESDWLRRHPQIRIGIMDAWPPINFLDERGRARGIGVDFIEKLNKRLGYRLIIEAAPFKQNYERVKNGELDAIMDISQHPDREPFFNFTRPYITISHVFVGRKDGPYFRSAADLKGKYLALEKGFHSVVYFKENYPEVKVREYASTADALDAVARGEADAYVGNRAVVIHLIQKELLINLQVMAASSHTSSVLQIGVRKDRPALAGILDKTLASITPRENRSIRRRWIGDVETDMSAIWLTLQEKNWLRDHPGIRIGIMNAWPPLNYLDERGRPRGIGVDFIEVLNKRLGDRLIIKAAPFRQNYDRVKNRELEALMDITQYTEREPFFNFTKPYLTIPHVLVGGKESPYFQSEKDLAGKTVALERGFYNVIHFQKNYPHVKVREYGSTVEALKAVSQGKADAYAGNRAVATYLIEKEMIPNLQFMGKLKKPASVLQIGTRKDWPELAAILDRALASITPEEERRILRMWVGEEAPAPIPLALTPAEQEWLARHPVMRVAGNRNFAPIEFADQNNKFSGVSVDYLKRISEILGIEFQYVKQNTWQASADTLRRRDSDIFSAAVETPDLNLFAKFTNPYLSLPVVIFTRGDAPYIGGLEELRDHKVVVVREHAISEFIRRNYPKIKMVEAKNILEALRLLQSKEAFAYIGSILVTSHYIQKMGYANLKVSGQIDYRYEIAMAVRSDWPLFGRILQKALNHISEQERKEIYKQWLVVTYNETVDYSIIWKLLIAMSAIVGVILFWNRKLTVEIGKRKEAESELKRHREHLEDLVGERTAELKQANHMLQTEIAERKRADKELRQYADAQAVLVREVNHRVKNNLSAIISMLHMEQDRAEAEGLASKRTVLQDVVGRIGGLSTVHSLLSASGWRPLEISGLCRQVVSAALQGIPLGKRINVEITPSRVQINSNQAHHLTLVINELTTNSMKYALEKRQQANIRIDIRQTGQTIEIFFKDDGPGYPDPIVQDGFVPSSTGFELIRGIVGRSLKGDVVFSNEKGALTRIVFKNELEIPIEGDDIQVIV